MRLLNNTILFAKIKESLSSVLPVVGVVFLLCFTIAPVPSGVMTAFMIGTMLLICGMGLFTLGADLAMTPMGEYVGSSTVKSRRLWFIIAVSFVVGILITVSEPDLTVLAEQVPTVPNLVLILAVALGVGLFLVAAMLRIFLGIPLRVLLIGFYAAVLVLAQFVPKDYLAVAFDSGGVTTGPMTVPFILALGAGVASTRSDSSADEDSFGLVALSSIGPVLAVLILGLVFSSDGGVYSQSAVHNAADTAQLGQQFIAELPTVLLDVCVALGPVVLFFGLFQLFRLRLKLSVLSRLGVGLIYTYVGLVLFLTGATVGFMPMGRFLGSLLGQLEYNWIVVPIGALLGYFIVAAEPAVHVLNKQVVEMSAGAIPKKAMSISLSVSVGISVALSMLRIITGLPLMWLLIPGYAIALGLTFISPKLFTAIAFDSGGVASGPMTATFLLSFAIGLCTAVGGNVAEDAFGVVAMVAMTPLITIQVLGIIYRFKSNRTKAKDEQADNAEPVADSELLDFAELMELLGEAESKGDTPVVTCEVTGDAPCDIEKGMAKGDEENQSAKPNQPKPALEDKCNE